MRTAFIVRPFRPRTIRNAAGDEVTIDFKKVHDELIAPALAAVGLQGGTTERIARAGNIRKDMFRLLVTTDLVIADISVHNANVFYELGVRHAARAARTFLLRCDAERVPFDLQTDRYLEYPAADPAAALPALIEGLRATLDSDDADSPVLQLLPALPPTDWARLLSVPADFREEVRRAEKEGRRGDLRLLSSEALRLPWAMEGLRTVGTAQFDLGDHDGARTTWEAVRRYDPDDVEANTRLATSYQRLGDLARSDEAVQRVIDHPEVRGPELAEALALRASNEKTRWINAWKEKPEGDERRLEALRSFRLRRAYEDYEQGFAEDRNHYYSGFNALALLRVWLELAAAYPDAWLDAFPDEGEAERERGRMEKEAARIAAAVELALETAERRAEFERTPDPWLKITLADFAFVTSTRPGMVAQRYREGLEAAGEFAVSVVRRQIDMYRGLGVLAANTAAVAEVLDEVEKPRAAAGGGPGRVIVFTGHRVDAPGRGAPRFPPAAEGKAREMIRAAVQAEVAAAAGRPVLGIAGAASGGDILFHEVCGELGVETQLFLVVSRDDYVRASVADGGREWVDRFNALFASRPYRFLGNSDHALELPRWLRPWKDYTVWNRSNLWMLHNALAYGPEKVALVALWNGRGGDGPGGTRDMVAAAEERGVKTWVLDAAQLLQA
ncbi:MAG TPA: tetratricopeptide repeat-containing protein [Longimicrobium sp.]|nr:tetratricopeptide repeat-containing protein [Longimicrobium sp.]